MKLKMKVQKKIVIIGVISCSILLGMFINSCNAVNETGNTTKSQNSNSTTTQNQKQNTTNTNKTTEKSNNANLDMLGIRPYDFSGFRYGTTSYEVEVPESTQSVEVYAEVQDKKATLTGTGKITLEKGENKAQVVVTAENGNKRTYTITIIRGGKKEEEASVQEPEQEQETTKPEQEPIKEEENGNGLQELKIENLELSPKFETNIYEYHTKYIGEATKLNIETKPTSANYVVEVTGNENLQEGENVITILVSEKNGDNVATYQINIDKSLVDEEAIAKQKEAEEREKQQKIIIGIIIGAVVVAAIVIIIKTKRKRKQKIEEDFFANPYYEDYDDYEEEEQQTPKAFHHNYEENNVSENTTYNDFSDMGKEEAKEQFLKGYTSQYDIDFGGRYQEERSRGKHKGKRFK